MCARTRNVITDVLPDVDAVVAALADRPVDAPEELRARVELAYLMTYVDADASDLEAAITALRARASGDHTADPFGVRLVASTFDELVATAHRAVETGRLDLDTVLALQFASGSIAAAQGHRLILFIGVNAEARLVMWAHGSSELTRRHEPPERLVELGRWLLLWGEMSTLAIGEGYRATEGELLARDVAARRAALDELLGAVGGDGRVGPRLRRLSMRYGLDPDTTFRLVAILPGPDVDPTPDEPGIDDEDLDLLARRIDHLIRRQSARDRPGTGISVPLAVTWRGSIVAILGPDRQEFTRLADAVRDVLGAGAGSAEMPSWVAVAMAADGVRAWSRTLVELQESLRIAKAIGRHGVIDDVAELGVERLLLSDPDLSATIIKRELGALLADPRMGEELVETLQVYVDAGGNRRETARRLHLADRTVAYRLERAEQLLGHGLDGEMGRRLNVALTLRRLTMAHRAPSIGQAEGGDVPMYDGARPGE